MSTEFSIDNIVLLKLIILQYLEKIFQIRIYSLKINSNIKLTTQLSSNSFVWKCKLCLNILLKYSMTILMTNMLKTNVYKQYSSLYSSHEGPLGLWVQWSTIFNLIVWRFWLASPLLWLISSPESMSKIYPHFPTCYWIWTIHSRINPRLTSWDTAMLLPILLYSLMIFLECSSENLVRFEMLYFNYIMQFVNKFYILYPSTLKH